MSGSFVVAGAEGRAPLALSAAATARAKADEHACALLGLYAVLREQGLAGSGCARLRAMIYAAGGAPPAPSAGAAAAWGVLDGLFLEAVGKSKPSTFKGSQYIKGVTISSSMSPAVKIASTEFSKF